MRTVFEVGDAVMPLECVFTEKVTVLLNLEPPVGDKQISLEE